MTGPLPTGTARRRNAPTIPTTQLPAEGRKGRAPTCPYELESRGRAWWRWAWRLPQAMAWSPGDLYVVGRRATLEDDDRSTATLREMRELDDRLGLTPKGMAALRWKIVATELEQPKVEDSKVASLRDRRAQLTGARAS